ncbi:hypothetical protein KC343_g4180 [Hortaea werneckii]|nr:hypothetical protein KC323_g7740 [Hortaea werneckii]KAI7251599.1 hypothetical protein KC352_g12554 [Hortaea werneckii]KAI7568093.1 hypothetical protein KC317_g4501 [Hortaea werneckii]KAI7620387.1 hypothetical protein KC346_g4145 [Hortaea werneckii]KAI7631198.1 hypothetical protein KC343_g4180 [Hortaea werneckii]
MMTSIRWPGVVFKGRDLEDRRTNLSLINSQGMSSALREAWEFNKNVAIIRLRLEEVLKLFACWNWDLFPEIQELEGYHRVWPGSHTSLIDVLRAENGLMIPPVIAVGNAEDVARSTFEAVKSRVQVMSPDSPLLRWPDCPDQMQWAKQSRLGYVWKKSWRRSRSLADPRDGSSNDSFCGLLRLAIFKEGAHASTEACEAALELEVYRLAKRVMSAWPDQFPVAESTIGNRQWGHGLQMKSGLCKVFVGGFCRFGERCRDPHVLQ